MTAVRQMSSTLRGQRALHVLQAPVPMPIEQSVSAALGRPSQPSASAKTAPLRTSSMMLTRRARNALLGRSRMLIAQRVWHAKALLTPVSAPIVLTVGPRMSSTAITRHALLALLALDPTVTGHSASAAKAQRIRPSASARNVLLRTSSTVLIRRAQAAVLDRCRTTIAQRV